MKILMLLLIAFFCCGLVLAQPSLDFLSLKHIQKIEKGKSAKDKLKQYKIFYSKDSIKHLKQLDKYWQYKSDSLLATTQIDGERLMDNASGLSKRDLRRISKLREKYNIPIQNLDTLKSFPDSAMLVEKAKLLGRETGYDLPQESFDIKKEGIQQVKNGLQNSSVAEVEEGREIAGKAMAYQNDFNDFQNEIDSYAQNDSLIRQELKYGLEHQVQERIEGVEELKVLEDYKKQVKGLDPSQHEYMKEFDNLQDSAYRKEQVKQKAEEMALDYIAENPAIMKAAKSKMDLLMKKYSIVPNSNDLSTAVKRTSLEGRSFKERLFVASNFQVLSLKPVAFDFSPLIGYRFSGRLIAGIGGNYRKTFGDSLGKTSSDMIGYKIFASYDVIKNFFAYSEFANNSTGMQQTESATKRLWNTSLLLGAGRKFTIHTKVEMTMVVLYNFARNPGDTVYPSPWIIRFGFQCSEIAFLKRKVYK